MATSRFSICFNAVQLLRSPWKAQHWIREVMDKALYPAFDGYCGDEDNGQTSAWYVFSAMGSIRYVGYG